MLNLKFLLETVAFNSDDQGYDYPEITGYGNNVDISLEHHHIEKPTETITIRIGDNLFLPSQLQFLLDEVGKYKKSLESYYQKD